MEKTHCKEWEGELSQYLFELREAGLYQEDFHLI